MRGRLWYLNSGVGGLSLKTISLGAREGGSWEVELGLRKGAVLGGLEPRGGDTLLPRIGLERQKEKRKDPSARDSGRRSLSYEAPEVAR